MLKKTLLIGSLMVLANYALAGDSVDLKVTAKLLTGSCTPALSNGSIVDFGHIPLNNLNKTSTNQLGAKEIELTITCSSDMNVAWTMIDNHHDTVAATVNPIADTKGGVFSANDEKFGLGETAGSVQIGAYGIRMTDVTYDGQKGTQLYTDNISGNYVPSGKEWGVVINEGAFVKSNGSRALTEAVLSQKDPVEAKIFKYTLKVSAAVDGTDTLAITDNTDLDGSATISIIYL